MLGRDFRGGKYRFGFQNQEKDSEIKGEANSINYKFRMHDTRIGRFFSIDPITKDFPWNSPFAFSENRVIDGVELEGKEVLLIGKQEAASFVLGIMTETGILVNISNGAVHGYVSIAGTLSTSISASTGLSFTVFPTMKNSTDASGWGTSVGLSAGPVIGTQHSGNIVYSSGKIGVNYTVGIGGSLNLLTLPVSPEIGRSYTNLVPLNEIANKEVLKAAQIELTNTKNTNNTEIASLNQKNKNLNTEIKAIKKLKKTESNLNKINSIQSQLNKNNNEINILNKENKNIESAKKQIGNEIK
jgi:hypothetical protein